MFDLAEFGRQIGEKLFALLSTDQKMELVQFIYDNETDCANQVNNHYKTRSREIKEGAVYFGRLHLLLSF